MGKNVTVSFLTYIRIETENKEEDTDFITSFAIAKSVSLSVQFHLELNNVNKSVCKSTAFYHTNQDKY